MKKLVFIITVSAVIAACLIVAVEQSKDFKAARTTARDQEIASLQQRVTNAEQTLKLHDGVNKTAVDNATTQITELNRQKAVLCTQIKAAKLPQALCP